MTIGSPMLRRTVVNRIDHISTAYEVLLEAFGPSEVGDPDKVLAQWDIETPHGWAEVYDYKSYARSPKEVGEWHVQAHSEEAFGYVYDRIREAAAAYGTTSGLG